VGGSAGGLCTLLSDSAGGLCALLSGSAGGLCALLSGSAGGLCAILSGSAGGLCAILNHSADSMGISLHILSASFFYKTEFTEFVPDVTSILSATSSKLKVP